MTQLSVTGFLVASVLIEDDSNRKEPLRVLGMDDSGKNWHTTKLAVEAWSTKSRVRQSRLSAKKRIATGLSSAPFIWETATSALSRWRKAVPGTTGTMRET